MKSKPVVINKIHTKHTSFIIDFEFNNNITMIMGDSGSGKSLCFGILKEYAVINSKIITMSYLDKNRDIIELIKNQKDKLFVIDNADILLTDEIKKYIALDMNNQYLIFGRNPRNLLITSDNIFEIKALKNEDITEFHLFKYI